MSAVREKELNRFPSGTRSREITLTLVALHQRFEAIRRAELTRLAPKLSALSQEARKRLDEITRLMVEKLLMAPTEQLKSVSDETMGLRYADALNRLFRLAVEDKVASMSEGVAEQPADIGSEIGERTAYPSELEEHIVLPNGRRLRIRALRRCEQDTVRELYDHLSPRTRYLRFFSQMPTLPDYMVRLLACVDYRRQLALVAEHDNGNGREIVALASFGAIDEGNVEVALVIRDDWQQQRLGTELAGRLLQAAEARGFHRFIANVGSDNVAIRRLLKNLGDVVSTKMSGGISELAFVRRRTN